MGRFTKIPQSTFQDLQLDAGVLLKRFNPDSPVAPADADIICATTGGISVSCVAEYSDFFEDVDNAPVNVKEGKHLDGWTCTMSTTSLGTSPELIQLSLGAADIEGETKIVPRRDLDVENDFRDIWWVGDKADGGMVAVQLMNALSTGGFTLSTSKNGKGQIGLELTGHVSIEDQDTVPMAFYSASGDDQTEYVSIEDQDTVPMAFYSASGDDQTEYVYEAVSPVGTENPSEEGWYVLSGDTYKLTKDSVVDENKTYYERTEA